MEPIESEPASFDVLQKDHALTILMDYAAATRRGWTAIQKEILSIYEKLPKNETPPNRQDFEAWARRDTIIGDQKFRWVYRFLTHPKTLARPEFAHAKSLLHPLHNVLRVGRVLGELFSSTGGAVGFLERDEEVADANYEKMSGLYAVQNGGPKEYWAFNRIGAEKFLVVQHFWIDTLDIGHSAVWNMHREAGFMILNQPVQCHMKDILTGEYRPHLFSIAMDEGLAHMAGDYLFYSAVEGAMRYSTEKDFRKAVKGGILSSIKELSSINDEKIEEFVEFFKWSVPV